MSIIYKKGDILTRNTEDVQVVVCHQVNCMGVMGAGLARQVRDQLPKAYYEYKSICNGKKNLLGTVQFVDFSTSEGYILANCFGQYNYGRGQQTNYDALRNCMRQVRETYPEAHVRIPYLMGCGLGEGNWQTVLGIIQEELTDKGIQVEVWALR